MSQFCCLGTSLDVSAINVLGYVRLERLKMAYYGEVVSLLLRKRSKVKNSSLFSAGFLWVLELSDQRN